MNETVSAVVKGCRPSVIKWVGKGTISDTHSKTSPRESSALPVLRDDTMSAQEHQPSKVFNESLEDKQGLNNDESSLPIYSIRIGGSHACPVCKKGFKWRSRMISHARIHNGERPYQCETCGKAFARSDGLQCHKRIHLEIAKPCSATNQPHFALGKNTGIDNVFLCPYCGRTLGSVAGFSKHIEQKHKDEQVLKCDICSINFNRPSALHIHNRVHNGLKPYRCDVCSKAFTLRGNLNRHLLIHSGERPYRCHYCTSSFNNSSHLARHVKAIHEGQ